MEEENSYISENGDVVFKSSYHQMRGYCCKAACLHCPYGTTLKKYGLEFKPLKDEDIIFANEIISTKPSDISIGDMLLREAGHKKKESEKLNINSNNKNLFYFIFLKGVICGLFHSDPLGLNKNNQLYLLPFFLNQELTKEIVESYFLSRSCS